MIRSGRGSFSLPMFEWRSVTLVDAHAARTTSANNHGALLIKFFMPHLPQRTARDLIQPTVMAARPLWCGCRLGPVLSAYLNLTLNLTPRRPPGSHSSRRVVVLAESGRAVAILQQNAADGHTVLR